MLSWSVVLDPVLRSVDDGYEHDIRNYSVLLSGTKETVRRPLEVRRAAANAGDISLRSFSSTEISADIKRQTSPLCSLNQGTPVTSASVFRWTPLPAPAMHFRDLCVSPGWSFLFVEYGTKYVDAS